MTRLVNSGKVAFCFCFNMSSSTKLKMFLLIWST